MADSEKDLTNVFNTIDSLLKKTDISDVDAETSEGFAKLPDGCYYAEVAKAKFKESRKGDPMVELAFKIVEDGITTIFDDQGNPHRKDVKGSKNRYVFRYYVINNEENVRRFVSDMMKFEGKEHGKPLLEKEMFTTAEVLQDALGILVGLRIWVQLSTNPRKNPDGTETSSQWTTVLSWKKAAKMGLPVD